MTVRHGRAAAEHPAERTVAMQNPMLALVVRTRLREMSAERLSYASDVLVVDSRQPFIEAEPDFDLAVPQHRLPARGPVDLVRGQVPVPQTVVGAARSQ